MFEHLDAASRNQESLDLKQKALVIVADILILAELCLAMYFANAAGPEFTPTFMKVFLGTAAPTLVIALLISRAMRQAAPVETGTGS